MHKNLVPKFRSPYPSDVLCPLHAQSGVCRGGYGYACIARERVSSHRILPILACSFQLHGKKLRC